MKQSTWRSTKSKVKAKDVSKRLKRYFALKDKNKIHNITCETCLYRENLKKKKKKKTSSNISLIVTNIIKENRKRTKHGEACAKSRKSIL